MTETIEATDINLSEFITVAAARNADMHWRFVEYDDVAQELHLYVLGGGKWPVEAAIAAGDEARLFALLDGVARQYCEREKAARSGYQFDDVAYYSIGRLADLIPLALDEGWDGLTGESEEPGRGSGDPREGGTLLAMVADVRSALGSAIEWAEVGDFDPEAEDGLRRLTALQQRLGGEFPAAPGYRRRSNG